MSADAQARVSQYDLESVYVFDFAKFVRWPEPAADKPFDLCVASAAGQKGFADVLKKTVAGETLDGRTLRVRGVDRIDDETGCNVLFLDGSAKNVTALLAAAAGKPILTVSDVPDFLASGGMIQFVTVDSRVRFSVNLTPVSRSGLSMNAELLKVAVKVQGKPGTEGQP